jgi:hypothetical protein
LICEFAIPLVTCVAHGLPQVLSRSLRAKQIGVNLTGTAFIRNPGPHASPPGTVHYKVHVIAVVIADLSIAAWIKDVPYKRYFIDAKMCLVNPLMCSSS